jgi:hypothetical protein
VIETSGEDECSAHSITEGSAVSLERANVKKADKRTANSHSLCQVKANTEEPSSGKTHGTTPKHSS